MVQEVYRLQPKQARSLAGAIALLLSTSMVGLAQLSPVDQLSSMSLEDLTNTHVTSVSKKDQKLSRVASAAYVLNREDIRRSGMTNIPDLLRIIPGVDVARVTSNTWAISVRGFNDRYSTKTLVLIDGRSVYTQEFSGVYWDQQSVPIEDIDRIEVIRGPGGTVWGANAVNGVINIITRSSRDTQGGLVSAGTGSQDSAQGLIQYGGKAGSKGTYRVFGKYFNTEKSVYADGQPASDGWHGTQGGFRSDWDLSSRDTLMVEGDLYSAREGQNITDVLSNDLFQTRTFNDPIRVDSANLMGKWNHTFANDSQTTLQVFQSHVQRFDQGSDNYDTTDADLEYRFKLGERHDLVSGVSYRSNRLDYQGIYGYRYDRPRLTSNLFSAFLQDEIKLTNAVALTVGSKIEHNSFTGVEFEPSMQVIWAPDDRKAVWFSAARAIQQPAWFYSNSQLDAAAFPLAGGGLGLFQEQGNHQEKAEQLLDYEIGYRAQFHKRLTLDVTGFRSDYRQVVTLETGTPVFVFDPPPPHLLIPAVWSNMASGRTYGAEVFANWQVTNRWRLSPGFSFLQMKISRDPTSNDANVEGTAGNSPKHQVQLRSTLNLRHGWEWDSSLYYVGALNTNLGGTTSHIDSYTRVDTRLGWRIGEFGEVSLVGQNLLSPRHAEFPDVYEVNSTQVQRSVFARLTWHF